RPWCAVRSMTFRVTLACQRDAPGRIAWTHCGQLLLGRVHDFDAAIHLPAILAVVLAHRALFAVAHDIELGGRGTGGAERARHGVAATLAEAEVVLARAALVGVALQRDARARELAQVRGMAADRSLELRLDVGLIEVEVDD